MDSWQGLAYVPCFWLVEGSPLTGEIDRPISPYRRRDDAEAHTVDRPALFVVEGTASPVFYPTLAQPEVQTCQP